MLRIASSPVSPAGGDPHQQPFSRVAPLLAAALLLGAGGGFVLAAVLSITQATRTADGLWWAALVQTHGHLQLYGWAGLFVIGVALHFLPRLRGAPLASPWLVPWILGALAGSLLLRALAQPFVTLTGMGVWRAGLLASGSLECLAIGGLLALLVATARRGAPLATRPALWSVLPFGVCAFSALGLATLANLANVTQAATAPSGLVPATGDDVNVLFGLLGFLVPMALAMSARSLPLYAGLDAFPRQMLWPTAFAYSAGLALAVIGTLGGARPGSWSGTLAGLGLALIGAMLVLYVAFFVRLMRARGRLPQRVRDLAPAHQVAARKYQTQISAERGAYGPFVALVASAYLWAMLGDALLVVDGLAQVAGRAAPVTPDAARHSLALGSIALLICGVAPRMVPGFSGGRIVSPKLVTATLRLGNTAALLRVGSLLAAPALAGLGRAGSTADELAFGLSGSLGLALAICLTANLWPALWPAQAAGQRTE